MTAPRSTARRIPERRTSGRQEEIPAADHEPCFLQGRALRAASCSRTRRRARALDRFQVRQSSSRVQRPRDRKSTRLNSSHLVISYAVFCLKKKNKKVTID